MQKCLLTVILVFSLISFEPVAQNAPADHVIRDSLFQLRPHENQVQQALIYLDAAELLKDSQPKTSFGYIVSAFKIAIHEKNDSLKARARIQMGDYYAERHRFINAQEQYLAACKAYSATGDMTGRIRTLLAISIINRDLQNYTKALDYLQVGMNIAKKAGSAAQKGLLLEQIGLNHQYLHEYLTAIVYFNEAATLFEQAGNARKKYRMQSHIGGVFLEENKDDLAMALYSKLLHDSDSSDFELRAVVLTRISHIYFKKGDHRKSLLCNLKALGYRQRRKVPAEISSSLINVAGDYLNLGKPDSAKMYMDSGLTLARKLDQKHLIENGYHHLYAYYNRIGKYKLALNYYWLYSNVHDDRAREQNKNNISLLETSQQLQGLQESGKMIAKTRDILSLNLRYHNYQSAILKVLLGMACFSMLVFVLLLLYVRRVRQKMQELNVQLSDEIREREITEKRTHEHENQYKFLTDNSLDFITHIDSRNVRTYASSASLKFYGYDPEEILVISQEDISHPDYHAFINGKVDEMIKTRSSQQFSYLAQRRDSSVFWVESILNPLFDPISGIYKGMVGVTRDINERKTKEFEIMEGTKHKENLLKEIHHRVKNNFAILVSLINMQMGQTKNQELLQSLTNLQLRIRTMSLVHEMLYRSGDFENISFTGYLRSLASVIAGTYGRRDVNLVIEADEMVMDIETSIPIGLIVNEILSNAYKHAFPGGRHGKILIRFTMDPKSGINTLIVQDDGIGMPEELLPDRFNTMGLQVVQILCAQIEGNLSVSNTPGVNFTIKFKVSVK